MFYAFVTIHSAADIPLLEYRVQNLAKKEMCKITEGLPGYDIWSKALLRVFSSSHIHPSPKSLLLKQRIRRRISSVVDYAAVRDGVCIPFRVK